MPLVFFWCSISKLCLHFLFTHPRVRFTYTVLRTAVREFNYKVKPVITYNAICSFLLRPCVLCVILLTDCLSLSLSLSVYPASVLTWSFGGAMGYPEHRHYLSVRANSILGRVISSHVPSSTSFDTVSLVQFIRHDN